MAIILHKVTLSVQKLQMLGKNSHMVLGVRCAILLIFDLKSKIECTRCEKY